MSGFRMKDHNVTMIGYILCIIFGVIICIWPGEVLMVICRIAGLLILLLGIFRLVICMKESQALHRGYPMLIGIILCIIGIWILSAPGTFLKLIPIVIGVVLIYQGARNIYCGIQNKKSKDSHWWIAFVIAVLSVIFGLILIRCAFLALEIGMIFIGIALIYAGVSGIWASYHSNGSRGRIIDVDYRED